MPDMQFLLNVNGYDINFFYELKPIDFELFPRVNEIEKSIECALSLWNLNSTRSETAVDMSAANRFALGQVFTQLYGVTYRFTQQKHGTVQLAPFIGRASKENSNAEEWVFILTMQAGLVSYLAIFSIMRFRRYRREQQ